MKYIIITFCSFLLFTACAKLPIQSVTLTETLLDEARRMHELNVVLVNKMFAEKRDKIDLFINNTYTPSLLSEITPHLSNDSILQELPDMLEILVPTINARRDSIQAVLEDQRITLISKLEADFEAYETLSIELISLLESAVNVNEKRQEWMGMVNRITNNKVDLNSIENSLDSFIIKGGNVSDNMLNLKNKLNTITDN